MKLPQRAREMAERTLKGESPEGFFIPYRHAAAVSAPGRYGAVEACLKRAEGAFRAVLDEIERCADALEALNGPPPLPRWGQDWFPRADGAAAYALIASRKPKRIVEVGSGHSTRFMAEAARAGGLETKITCIDPAPRAALLDLPVDWRRELLSEAHLPLFEALAPGDVAFFDSSHVLVPGSDVDMILNRILPALKPGVLVHVHDILLPDPYPPEWEWRGYAEQNGLGPWILSGGLRPVFSSRYAVTRMRVAESGALSRLPLKAGAIENEFLGRAGMSAPYFILVEPQMAENIGGAARAMWNFGLRRMRVVAPRDGWPSPKAVAMASGAGSLLEDAGHFDDTAAATADLTHIYATTARPRGMTKRVLTPAEAMAEAAEKVAAGEKVGVLFGRERTGLETADIVRANTIITVPVNPDFPSLNLAQCVLLTAYEWRRATGAEAPEIALTLDYAAHGDVERMLDHLIEELDRSGFFFPETKRASMLVNLRNLFHRAPLTEPDVRTLHGVIRALAEKPR